MAEISLPTGWLTFQSGCAPCVPQAGEDGIEEKGVLFNTGIGSATRFSWSFIGDNPDGEIVYEAATNEPFASMRQMYKSTNDVTTTDVYPDGVNDGANNLPGVADRVLFALGSGGLFYLFTLEENSQIIFNISAQGFGDQVRNWSVDGNTLIVGGNTLTSGGDFAILKYNIATQAFVTSTLIAGITSVQSIHFNGEFVYILVQTSATGFKLLKYDVDLNEVGSFTLTPAPSGDGNNTYLAAYAESDDVVWLLRRDILGGGVAALSYLSEWETQVVIDNVIPGTSFANDSASWNMIMHEDETTGRKYFYLGRQTESVIYKYGFVECAA